MASRCILCANRKTVGSGPKNQMSFYGFPKDEAVRKEWIKFCGRQEHEVYKSNKICSDHFIDDDFIDNRASGGIRWLKKGTIPSRKKGLKRHIATTKEVTTSLLPVRLTSNLTSSGAEGPYLCSEIPPVNVEVNMQVGSSVPLNGNGDDSASTVSSSGLQLSEEIPTNPCLDKSPIPNVDALTDPNSVVNEEGDSSSVSNHIDHLENAMESHSQIDKPLLECDIESDHQVPMVLQAMFPASPQDPTSTLGRGFVTEELEESAVKLKNTIHKRKAVPEAAEGSSSYQPDAKKINSELIEHIEVDGLSLKIEEDSHLEIINDRLMNSVEMLEDNNIPVTIKQEGTEDPLEIYPPELSPLEFDVEEGNPFADDKCEGLMNDLEVDYPLKFSIKEENLAPLTPMNNSSEVTTLMPLKFECDLVHKGTQTIPTRSRLQELERENEFLKLEVARLRRVLKARARQCSVCESMLC